VLDLDAPSTPVIKVFEERFFGDVPVYIRGGMNGWSAEAELTWQGDGGYATQLSLHGGATEFNVASEDCSTVNLGNPDTATDNTVGTAQPIRLASNNNNLLIDLPAGDYEFRIYGSDGNEPFIVIAEK